MKKNTFAIIGFILQIIGVGLMLYGFSNNQPIVWIGLPIVFVGLALILLGLYKNSANTK